MGPVNMTVSSTPCCTRRPPERAARGWLRWWWCAALACVLALCLPPLAARAQGHGEVASLEVEHTAAGVFLTAALRLELPALVEDALDKGISMHFVAQAEVVRQRWYWSDKTVASATRYLRLSYQPLTRRWRLAQSAEPFGPTGLGMALGQSFDDLDEALSAMQRIARWKIADGGAAGEGGGEVVNFQFRLDMSQLPRPLQIGAVGRSGWSMALARSVPLPLREAAP